MRQTTTAEVRLEQGKPPSSGPRWRATHRFGRRHGTVADESLCRGTQKIRRMSLMGPGRGMSAYSGCRLFLTQITVRQLVGITVQEQGFLLTTVKPKADQQQLSAAEVWEESVASRLVRLLASGLVFNATFPLDALAATNPVSVVQPAPAQPFNAEQLDALLASIALYPDELLTQLLMASTFPLEVVAAARWVEAPAHKSLTGDALPRALEAEPWDPSVKSLVPFPVVLATLNNNLPWLQQLGYAFATQQADVFASIQRLRQQAQASGHLESSAQQVVSTQKVTVEPSGGGAPAGGGEVGTQQEVIVIEPAQADTVYVPSYNPATVYGDWPYPSYPPYYAAPPTGYYFGTHWLPGLLSLPVRR